MFLGAEEKEFMWKRRKIVLDKNGGEVIKWLFSYTKQSKIINGSFELALFWLGQGPSVLNFHYGFFSEGERNRNRFILRKIVFLDFTSRTEARYWFAKIHSIVKSFLFNTSIFIAFLFFFFPEGRKKGLKSLTPQKTWHYWTSWISWENHRDSSSLSDLRSVSHLVDGCRMAGCL